MQSEGRKRSSQGERTEMPDFLLKCEREIKMEIVNPPNKNR